MKRILLFITLGVLFGCNQNNIQDSTQEYFRVTMSNGVSYRDTITVCNTCSIVLNTSKEKEEIILRVLDSLGYVEDFVLYKGISIKHVGNGTK